MIDDPIPGLKEQLRQSILAETGRMNQLAAARMLGVDEPRMSNLEHGRLERFSLQKLIRLLARMNRRVDLTVVTVGPLPRRRYNQHLLAPPEWRDRTRGA
ncbi:MAG TPA: XRE family transcriptional regulator [Gemmatimonadaceae bacterium]|nr:XRE family transcriptional regulator [Gemmatimonadaceae bacterium]